jgi:lipoyl(octanoyl) transferase
MQHCEICRLGRLPYAEAWDLQDRLVDERSQDLAPDRLLLTEHPPSFTQGSSSHDGYILWDETQRRARGVELFRSDRGGDVTYHGPGQLVVYPIVKLERSGERLKLDVLGYLRRLEAVVITSLADYDIHAFPIAGLTGVWVNTPNGEAKICAIGVKINVKAVTKHGFALNINTDMSYFEGIVPCGIADKGVTSMTQILGRALDMGEVTGQVIRHFGEVFDYEMIDNRVEHQGD